MDYRCQLQQNKLFKKELKEEINFRKKRKDYNQFIERYEICYHTKLSAVDFNKKNKEVTIYFYSIMNGGVFGRIKVSLLSDYRRDGCKPPVIEFLNPIVYTAKGPYSIGNDCSRQWSPALTPRMYLDSLMCCPELYFSGLNWDDDHSIAELLRYFPNEKFKSKM